MSAITSHALVGLGLPERFALGAAIGHPERFIRSSAALLSGILTATVSSPPVVLSGTPSFFLRTIVSGPGQKLSISATMSALSIGVSWPMSLALDMWTIIGLSLGLPFASYTLATASASSALAPRPYTVSVGNATSPPLLIISAAILISFSSVVSIFVFIAASFRRRLHSSLRFGQS